MNAPMAFSDVCYQWGANTPFLNRNVPLEQAGWGTLSENLKGVARVIYVIGVSTLIAPTGLVYHLVQAGLQNVYSRSAADQDQANELSQRGWLHLRCSEKDLFSFFRGCVLSGAALCGGIIAVSLLRKGVIENDLLYIVSSVFCGIYANSLIFDQSQDESLIYYSWDNLALVSDSLNQNHLRMKDIVKLVVFVYIFNFG